MIFRVCRDLFGLQPQLVWDQRHAWGCQRTRFGWPVRHPFPKKTIALNSHVAYQQEMTTFKAEKKNSNLPAPAGKFETCL